MPSYNSFASTWCCRSLALTFAIWSGSAWAAGTITVSSGTIGTVQSGSGGLDKITDGTGTNGTATLSAVNTYTGGTTVTAGTLAVSNPGTLGDVTNFLTVSTSGVMDLGGTTQTTGLVTLGGGTIQNGTVSTGTTFALQGGTVSATMAGAANLTQTAGSSFVSGANTFTGGTTVTGGTLVVGSGTALGASGGQVVINGGTMMIGSQFLIYDFSGSGGQIIATGDMEMGSFSDPAGFNYSGAVNVGTHSVQFLAGGTTTVGAVILAAGGQLTSFHGIVLQAGGTMSAAGTATISNPFQNTQVLTGVVNHVPAFNSATVQGPTTAGQFLVFTGPVTGGGNLNGNIKLLNAYTPGANGGQTTIGANSNIAMGSGSSFNLNLGGIATPGYSYNQIILSSGAILNLTGASLAFTFNGVDSGGTFSPALGNQFQLFVNNSGSLTGTFTSLPSITFGLQSGLMWDFSNLYSQGLADVVVVPEPSTVAGIIGAATLGFAAFRRRRQTNA